jgi:Domain of unknown function (DUF1906)
VINGKISTLPDGTIGFDITTPLNPATAQQYLAKGYGFVVRYVGRGDDSRTFVDIDQGEAEAIVDAGLGLCIVQHPLAEGWGPTAAKGQQFGSAAASLASQAGLPFGMTLWLDLEGVAPVAQTQDVIDYCNQWYDEVFSVGYVPGVYIGANPGLSADQIYWDLKMTSYWRGGSSEASGVPADIPNRGYQMIQRITGAGSSEFDSNVVSADHFGGTVKMCVSL